MLDSHRLRLLKEFAERGTIVAAAAALGYTPSAVSQQLAALEREAGVTLLDRTARAGDDRGLPDRGRRLRPGADPQRAGPSRPQAAAQAEPARRGAAPGPHRRGRRGAGRRL